MPALKEQNPLISDHPSAEGKKLVFNPSSPDQMVFTDLSMITRVICNMMVNALEATSEGEKIIVSSQITNDNIKFSVWNKKVIPEEIQKRLFQRNFSTQNGFGRGLGTYSMKLLGEEFLGGKVGFSSAEEDGTEFHITLNHLAGQDY